MLRWVTTLAFGSCVSLGAVAACDGTVGEGGPSAAAGGPTGVGGAAGAGAGGSGAGSVAEGTTATSSGGGAASGGGADGGSGGAAGSASTATSGGAGPGAGGGDVACVTTCPGGFPQGVPDEQFIASAQSNQDTDPSVDAAVNAVMVALTGCGVSTDCDLSGFAGSTAEEVCQSWFSAVTAALVDQGYCAGQHAEGSTDEIAVSNTCCEGKWYGYHICNYGGPKDVWAAGARRGWWMIEPSYCGQ